VSESGVIAAQYVYDPYGNVIEQYGNLSDEFAFRFSTKYYDSESGMVSYQRRFYRPDHGRWLNHDPIEEEGGVNLYAFCDNSVMQMSDIFGLIPVTVVTTRWNNFWQMIFSGGAKTSDLPVNDVSDIQIYDLDSTTLWGVFSPSLNIGVCSLEVNVKIALRHDLVESGKHETTYYFTPHKVGAAGGSSSSDGSPQVRGGILAHEQGHALSFLTKFLEMFKSRVGRFKAGNLSESDKQEIRRIYNDCLNECQNDSGDKANEAQTNWYKEHGYDIQIK